MYAQSGPKVASLKQSPGPKWHHTHHTLRPNLDKFCRTRLTVGQIGPDSTNVDPGRPSSAESARVRPFVARNQLKVALVRPKAERVRPMLARYWQTSVCIRRSCAVPVPERAQANLTSRLEFRPFDETRLSWHRGGGDNGLLEQVSHQWSPGRIAFCRRTQCKAGGLAIRWENILAVTARLRVALPLDPMRPTPEHPYLTSAPLPGSKRRFFKSRSICKASSNNWSSKEQRMHKPSCTWTTAVG